MSRYILIRRLRGPAILLLIGVLALLHQMGVIEHLWSLFWPLLLILVGVMLLAERAVLAQEGYPLYPGTPWQGAHQNTGQGAPQSAEVTGTAIVPAHDFGKDMNGGQQ